MTKEEQQTIFKWLCEAIGNGTKIPFKKYTRPNIYVNDFDSVDLVTVISYKEDLDLIRPICRPLSMLTKPIKVEGYNEGKEFVPIEELSNICKDVSVDEDLDIAFNNSDNDMILFEEYSTIMSLVLSWGFFIYDQTYFDKGYLIKESEI